MKVDLENEGIVVKVDLENEGIVVKVDLENEGIVVKVDLENEGIVVSNGFFYFSSVHMLHEMGGVRSTCRGEERCIQGFGGETWGKRPLGRPRRT